MEQESEKREDTVIGSEVDAVLEDTGPCGSYQLYLHLFFSVVVLSIAYHGTLVQFTSQQVPWICKHRDQSTFCRNNVNKTFTEHNQRFSERCKLNHTAWTYNVKANYSLVSEFNLVCKNSPKAIASNFVFYFGGIIGAIISGICSDFYGRKRILIVSLLFVIIASIECSFIKNIWQLMLVRGLLGAAQTSALITAFVLILEFIAPCHRAISVGFFQVTFCVSQVILAALAYKRTNWRHLQYYASYPVIIPLIMGFFLSESPRWLLTSKQKSIATRILKTISKFNGNNHHNIKLKYLDTYPSNRSCSPDVFRHCHILLISLAQGILWFTIAMFQYYIIDIVSLNLDGNMYKAFGLSTLANLPGCFAAIATCTQYGRRKSLLVSLVITGIAIALNAALKGSSEIALISLAIIVKFLVNLAYISIWLWSFELFPTVMRSRGLSLCVSFERLGSLCIPLLLTAFPPSHSGKIHIIMSIAAIISALIASFLPETGDEPTRETQDDFFNKPDDYQIISP